MGKPETPKFYFYNSYVSVFYTMPDTVHLVSQCHKNNAIPTVHDWTMCRLEYESICEWIMSQVVRMTVYEHEGEEECLVEAIKTEENQSVVSKCRKYNEMSSELL